MPDLTDGQWRLVYPGVDFVFGTPATPTYHASAPDLGDIEVRSEDADRPRQDGRAFGVDYRGGRTVTFDMGVYGADETAARASAAELRRAWRADSVRGTAGAVAELQVQTGTKPLRSMFGRPRRLAINDQDIKSGVATVDADFAAVDDLFYGWITGVTVGFASALGGGLMSPLASPLTSTTNSDRSSGITVGGEMPVWPIVSFDGPITNPELTIAGLWKLALDQQLSAGTTVTIDTTPWNRTVLRSDGASLAGALTRDSVRLARAAIPPGSYEIGLRGIDSDGSGTAKVHVNWRNVYNGL